jgi:TfoX/Sxy family transcriptional regulator of competence genes
MFIVRNKPVFYNGARNSFMSFSKKIKKEQLYMASSKEYLDFILDQLSGLDEISCRAMMGEYIVYYRGRIVGGIYDDRFLVKPTKSAVAMMPDADKELPYEGAKEMLLVDNVENREFLQELLNAMYEELPAPKKRKK